MSRGSKRWVGSAGSWAFAPPTSVAFTQLEVYSTGANFVNNEVSWDGNTVTGVTNSWVQVTNQAGEISVDKPLTITVINTSASACLGAIRINGDTILVDAGPLAAAQATFPSGMWWIKDMVNANQNQLVDSLRGPTVALWSPTGTERDNPYDPPTGESVAWCWNWDSSNPEKSWFNIVNDPSASVGTPDPYVLDTGLTAPDMVFFNSDFVTNVLHSAMDGMMQLNNPDALLPYAAGYGIQPDGTIKVDGAFKNGPVICYAWKAVPGYSAFGSYTGNSSSDNAFVYTGFKPAFVLIKSTAGGADWQIYDTTRSPYNPCEYFLSGNSTLPETTGFDIDILSNGFKIRSANGPNGTANCIYAAFAENPFQSPVTAR